MLLYNSIFMDGGERMTGLAAMSASGAPAPVLFARLRRHERRAWIVGVMSLLVMGLELGAGWVLNSVALVSDGLHTITHVGVMAVAATGYRYVDRHRDDPRFAFGPGKVVSLAGFANGAGLAVFAAFIALESVERLIRPEPVAYRDAAVVAAVSLVVGGVSAALLHQHQDAREQGPRDLNLWAAYLHMVADVATSVLALAGLAAGAWLGWRQLDSLVGVLNAGVVAAFAVQLLKRSSASLLDIAPAALDEARRQARAAGADVRAWSVSPGRYWVLVRSRSEPSAELLDALAREPGVDHVLVEARGRR